MGILGRGFGYAMGGTARAIGLAQKFVPRTSPPPEVGTSGYAAFRSWLDGQKGGTLLELGTRRVVGTPSTARRDWAPQLGYIACDFEAGDDVDIVADAEKLSSTFEVGSIDAIVACSVFEHIRKPWLAAEEMGKVLRPGGRI